MYLVVYGLRNEGLTDHLATLLDLFAGYGVWGATFGTGLLIAFLSSIMNNMPTVLVGALSIDASQAEGIVREAMIHANVIGSDLGRSEEHTSELQSLMRISYAVFCLKKQKNTMQHSTSDNHTKT